MNDHLLLDWCRKTALPVLEAAAAGQPIGYAAEQAMRSLRELLAAPDGGAERDATRWHFLCRALDAGDGAGLLAKAVAGGSATLERLIDAMPPRGAGGYA
ncbi:hypothetical protein RKE25_13610 [Dyella sp. BiH032]|uniref:hypothetical protein n=1 Tax=Dyella sp. BiH032 TaxID=3075430 RepID=UPI002892ADD9|nr:hypothetical protein [Dyella sp. BiH032]WNL44466.1 hypothetical protein RKE25_13610 [Dyella sp. BiH032]